MPRHQASGVIVDRGFAGKCDGASIMKIRYLLSRSLFPAPAKHYGRFLQTKKLVPFR
jgi:hypothetical protein